MKMNKKPNKEKNSKGLINKINPLDY